MKELLHSIIIVAICIAIFNQLLPVGHGLEKYARFIGMLVIAAVLFSPIVNLIKGFDEDYFADLKEDIVDIENGGNNEYSDKLYGYLKEYSIEQFKQSIKEIMSSDFGVPSEDCEISIETKVISGELKIDKLQILLSGRSIFKNPYEIENYFAELIDCQCTVLIKSS